MLKYVENYFCNPVIATKLSYLASKNISFMSKLALNINMLVCNLISVMALGGKECPTATRPILW